MAATTHAGTSGSSQRPGERVQMSIVAKIRQSRIMAELCDSLCNRYRMGSSGSAGFIAPYHNLFFLS